MTTAYVWDPAATFASTFSSTYTFGTIFRATTALWITRVGTTVEALTASGVQDFQIRKSTSPGPTGPSAASYSIVVASGSWTINADNTLEWFDLPSPVALSANDWVYGNATAHNRPNVQNPFTAWDTTLAADHNCGYRSGSSFAAPQGFLSGTNYGAMNAELTDVEPVAGLAASRRAIVVS
jgi:hypothetical protein